MRELGPDSVAALEAAMGDEARLVRPRLERGCRCWCAWRGQQLVAYGWLSSGPEWIGELQLELRPGPGEAYVWNCVTLPAHRRQGIFRGLLVTAAEQCRREGLRRLWIGSQEDPAEKAVVDAGFVPVLRFQTLLAAGLIWLRVSPAGGPALVTAAQAALEVSPGGHLRRARRRRH